MENKTSQDIGDPGAALPPPEKANVPNDVKSESNSPRDSSPADLEQQATEPQSSGGFLNGRTSAFKAMGWLDRLLAVWIFLAMAIGIILGNFVPNIGPALQKGKFVDVSVPIGMFMILLRNIIE